MLKTDIKIGNLSIQIEANSTEELFLTINDLIKAYKKHNIEDEPLIMFPKAAQNSSTNKIESPITLNKVATLREPDETIQALNKLITAGGTGELVPLFAKGTFKAKELILIFLYYKYLQESPAQLKEITEFLRKENISQGAKDTMMSYLRQDRIIIQKDGAVEILNLPAVREVISKMTTKLN